MGLKFALIFGTLCISILYQVSGQRKFSDSFKFGAATASYQIEGGWDADGKGESVWDHLSHNSPGRIKDHSNGDVACDSYNLYKRDVEMLAELGVDFYRFSLSWPRILPNGFSNKKNQPGIDYYNNLINTLISNGIEPVVTLYHWELPQNLQNLGGWANPVMADYFAEFADVAFKEFGDRVKLWLTFNEPKEVCLSGYGIDSNAPALNMSGVGEYLCAHTLLRAHGKSYRIYDKLYRPLQNGRVSLTLSSRYNKPETDTTENVEAALKATEFSLGWYANPIFSEEGNYPAVMREAIAMKSQEQGYSSSRLPVFTPDEIEYIRGSFDFFGLNFYTSRIINAKGPQFRVPSFDDDLGVLSYMDNTWEPSASDWLKVTPWGLRKLLNWIKDHYGNPEIMIFENGFSDKGDLNDGNRIDYYRGHLNAVLDAIDDGCTVTGFTAWSLMDNFEWMNGYTEKFGLYHVDYSSPTKTRTPKASARFYHEIIKNRVISDYESSEDLNVKADLSITLLNKYPNL